jgi:hypothetical protein
MRWHWVREARSSGLKEAEDFESPKSAPLAVAPSLYLHYPATRTEDSSFILKAEDLGHMLGGDKLDMLLLLTCSGINDSGWRDVADRVYGYKDSCTHVSRILENYDDWKSGKPVIGMPLRLGPTTKRGGMTGSQIGPKMLYGPTRPW